MSFRPQFTYDPGARGTTADPALQQQADFTKNAYSDYTKMLADNAAQEAANKKPLAGEGFLQKAQAAVEGSPQLQSGLLAAGLSLMFGNPAEDAVSAGLTASATYNGQVQAEEESKKAQLLGGIKQQSQIEGSYADANLKDRQPDTSGAEASRFASGVATKQQGLDYLRLLMEFGDNYRDKTAIKDEAGNIIGYTTSPETSTATARNLAATIAETNGVTIGGVQMPARFPLTKTTQVTPNILEAVKRSSTPDQLVAAGWANKTPQEKYAFATHALRAWGANDSIKGAELVDTFDKAWAQHQAAQKATTAVTSTKANKSAEFLSKLPLPERKQYNEGFGYVPKSTIKPKPMKGAKRTEATDALNAYLQGIGGAPLNQYLKK